MGVINYRFVAREFGYSEKNAYKNSPNMPKRIEPVIKELEKSAAKIIEKHKKKQGKKLAK